MLQTTCATQGGQFVTAHQRLTMYGAPWPHFEVQLELVAEASGPCVDYLHATMKVVRPSMDHNPIKSVSGSLVEEHALGKDTYLILYGWTRRRLGMSPQRLGSVPNPRHTASSSNSSLSRGSPLSIWAPPTLCCGLSQLLEIDAPPPQSPLSTLANEDSHVD